jgi:four helix bundle protein
MSEGENRDLEGRLFAFALRIVRLCQVLDERPGVARTLAGQLLRSGTAIGANYEEAQAGQSKKDFLCKVSIALKEARESHYWLKLLSASEIAPSQRLADLLDEMAQIAKILGAIVSRTKHRLS